jgi:uncharacterized membrane protein
VPLRGVLHARMRTLRRAALLVIAYFIEGVVRSYADSGWSQLAAALEVLLALVFFATAFAFLHLSRKQ